MMLESERKTIRAISKWRYEVTLLQDKRGVFHVDSENLLTKKLTSISFVDYKMADYTFNSKIQDFEGN